MNYEDLSLALQHIRALLNDGSHPGDCDAHNEKGKADPNRCSVHHELRTDAKRAAFEFLDKLDTVSKYGLMLVKPDAELTVQFIVPADFNSAVRFDFETGYLWKNVPREHMPWEHLGSGLRFFRDRDNENAFGVIRSATCVPCLKDRDLEFLEHIQPTMSFTPNKEQCSIISIGVQNLPFPVEYSLVLRYDYWGKP